MPVLRHALVFLARNAREAVNRFRFTAERVIAAAARVVLVHDFARERAAAYFDEDFGVAALTPLGQLFGQFFGKVEVL